MRSDARGVPANPAGQRWILLTAAYNIAVNWFGIKTSARFNLGTLLLQFAMLFVFLGAGIYMLARSGMPRVTYTPRWGAATTPAGVFSAASLCVMAYLGFDAITTLSGDVRHDQRHLFGRAVSTCRLTLGALAIIDVWVLSDLSRGLAFKDPTTATFETISVRIHPLFRTVLAWAMALVVAVSITPPMVTGVSHILYAMGHAGALRRPLAAVHPRYRVPHVALLTSGVASIAIALYFAGEFDTLTSIVNFGALAAFTAVNASTIMLFAVARRSRRRSAHVVSPLLGIAALAAVMAQMSRPALVVGVAWLAAGGIVQRRRAGTSGRRGRRTAVP